MTSYSTSWMEEASCMGKGVEMFFADSTFTSTNKKIIAQAKAICKNCPVSADCLSYAFNNDESFGVWGSFSAKERSAIRKHFNIKTLSKGQAKQIVNKSVLEIKETFKNTIFVEGKYE